MDTTLATIFFAMGGTLDGLYDNIKRPRQQRYLRKDECINCNHKIPPGRAGRKCEKCRQNPPDNVKEHKC